MPAVMPDNPLVLPRVTRPDALTPERPVVQVVSAIATLEGAGFPVRRPFPSRLVATAATDPFLLLDHMGAVEYGPGEAKGAPWHPHRGFETVTYMMDGALRHRDSTGGGGLITDGATQWMTAGAGILHDEMPPDDLVARGGLFHGVQLWVNLPRALKWTPPRYQDIEPGRVTLLASDDGGAVLRLIAGELADHRGPGQTWTPITYLHATVSAGAAVTLPWRSDFNALVYVLAGDGWVGPDRRPISEGQLAVFGPGAKLSLGAAARPSSRTPALDALVLGGQPIREPVVFYGPFVMNTHEEIVQALEDFRAGRMGHIPAQHLPPPNP